ncbi:hypothetical protein TOK_0466 [Pseudonocardia sp. N23]|nr:hypothetical protein TOK_0466 [Pseudonocardia sp. N23]
MPTRATVEEIEIGRAALPSAARPAGVLDTPVDNPVHPVAARSPAAATWWSSVPGGPPRCCPPARQERLCRTGAGATSVLTRRRGWG